MRRGFCRQYHFLKGDEWSGGRSTASLSGQWRERVGGRGLQDRPCTGGLIVRAGGGEKNAIGSNAEGRNAAAQISHGVLSVRSGARARWPNEQGGRDVGRRGGCGAPLRRALRGTRAVYSPANEACGGLALRWRHGGRHVCRGFFPCSDCTASDMMCSPAISGGRLPARSIDSNNLTLRRARQACPMALGRKIRARRAAGFAGTP